jgi:hypothetical protein
MAASERKYCYQQLYPEGDTGQQLFLEETMQLLLSLEEIMQQAAVS